MLFNVSDLVLADNTAWILTRRGGWSQQEQTVFYLPIFISDGEKTSTSTLTIRVCSCDLEGNVMSCSAEAYSLPASLSRGALIAILACIFVLLGELRHDTERCRLTRIARPCFGLQLRHSMKTSDLL